MHFLTHRSFLASIVVLTIGGLLSACIDVAEPEPPLFERLAPEETNIAFVNELPEEPDINILNYLYYYNGGGVAVGDVTGNGYPDLYFTSNLGPNRLYANHGDFVFEDITEEAGVAGDAGWASGVTMADINGNGLIDIYVSTVTVLDRESRNHLFINNGDGTFTDRAEEYGIAHVGYSTQAAFFDANGNGLLDMFLLNHAVHTERSFRSILQRDDRDPYAGDKLFLNTGNRFVDVSEEAGIIGGPAGYGLGVAISDFNWNGCPDIYVGNDFHENDFLYLNNCDGSGTFTESIASAMGHTSYFSMGVDAADFTNNGLIDLAVLDMQPEREDIFKTSANAERYDTYHYKLSLGYHPQYARNTLQLNRGNGKFSEIGYLAGVHATDWSWAALFVDLDNDGTKDLFVTNGIYRRPNDLDYINYISNAAIQASLERGITEENVDLLDVMPQIRIPNFAFQNNGDLTFTNRADEWGLHHEGFSNGAAYVDLNNDGALDLVVNNINEPASIYRNRAREFNGNHYLKVALEGEGANTLGIGAKVKLKTGGKLQLQEQQPTRGFQSSVDHRLNFGLGSTSVVDSVIVIWPDGRMQVIENVEADQMITFRQEEADRVFDYEVHRRGGEPLFEDVTGEVPIDFRHEENTFVDFNREPFMPHKLSMEGPALAVGDVTGNGLDDIYVGGAKWQPGALFLQEEDGSFRRSNDEIFEIDSTNEDVDAVLFDATGNGHLDLYVVSGGHEFWGEHEALLDRLYINDGQGGFERSTDRLPLHYANGGAVAVGDFTGNGHLDLFVGSHSVAREYGMTPRSVLLENDGRGYFRDVTEDRANGLAEVGMVTDAVWADVNGSGRLDLVIVGEWMPVTVFEQQENGLLVDRTEEVGFARTNGWWNSIAAADLTGNGLPDLVLGNLGLNSYIHASNDEPARLTMKDFSSNGRLDQILTFYKDGVSYPMAGRDDFVTQMPFLRSRYPTYADFADTQLEDIFSRTEVQNATVKEAYTFASSVALNRGDGSFEMKPLPTEAQFSKVYAILVDDVTGNGIPDLVLGGNFNGVKPIRGRYDACSGLVLRGEGLGDFTPMELSESNLVLSGDIRHLRFLNHADGSRSIVAARNNDRLQVVRHQRPAQETITAAN